MKTDSPIKRRASRQIMVGNVAVGGDAPISVQSMTNTETCDVAATVAQVQAIADAGADIVRISVPSMEAAEAFRDIRAQVAVPLVHAAQGQQRLQAFPTGLADPHQDTRSKRYGGPPRQLQRLQAQRRVLVG